MGVLSESKVLQAFQTLFGNQVNVNREFLTYVQPSGVKSAYRKKAKENHPDLFATQPAHVQERQTAELRQIVEAYDVLNQFFTQRENVRRDPVRAAQHSRSRKPEAPGEKAGCSTSRSYEYRGGDRYYTRGVPPRALLLGKYLFYRGKITFGLLVEALLWQRRRRPDAGEVALRWGLLDKTAVARISRLCRDPRMFGDKAVELGLLTMDQAEAIQEYQRSFGFKLGEYFVEKKIFTREEMDAFVREHNEHNAAILAAALQKRPRSSSSVSGGAAEDLGHHRHQRDNR